MTEKQKNVVSNIEKLSYLGFGKDIINQLIQSNNLTTEDKLYLTNVKKENVDDIDDKINITISAYKLKFSYEPVKKKFYFKNNKNKKITLNKFSEYLIDSLKIKELENLIKKEEYRILHQIDFKVEANNSSLIFLDMEQAERLLNVNIIENDEESFIARFSNEKFLEIDEAKGNILSNLRSRFGLNVNNISVVNNQFIINTDNKISLSNNTNFSKLNMLTQKIQNISKNKLK
jgi:hypothetical protein